MTKEPIPVLPTVHYNMGGIPTNYMGEVVTLNDGDPDTVVPGLFAIGEAACVSVHGANRLGSNSLLDLIVFGRAVAQRCAEVIKPNMPHPESGADRLDALLGRFDALRHADGGNGTAEIRDRMQAVMQNNAAVFRTGEVLEDGCRMIGEVNGAFGDVGVTDRSLVWNSDLVETLELRNLLGSAVGSVMATAAMTLIAPAWLPALMGGITLLSVFQLLSAARPAGVLATALAVAATAAAMNMFTNSARKKNANLSPEYSV